MFCCCILYVLSSLRCWPSDAMLSWYHIADTIYMKDAEVKWKYMDRYIYQWRIHPYPWDIYLPIKIKLHQPIKSIWKSKSKWKYLNKYKYKWKCMNRCKWKYKGKYIIKSTSVAQMMDRGVSILSSTIHASLLPHKTCF